MEEGPQHEKCRQLQEDGKDKEAFSTQALGRNTALLTV
jgi:hypothetical protein